MAAYANGAGARVLSSEERLPVSANQRALWFLYQYAPDSSAYNMAFLARINPLLDVDHLRMACRQTIQRHAVLHTCFRQEHSNVVATVSDIPPMFFSHVVDLEREAIGRWYADFADTPFRLEHGEVCRMAVLDVEGSPACRYLAVAAHHIVADHYSLERIVANIDEDYAALTSSRTPAPTPSFGFPEWCLEQAQHTSSIDGEASLAFWRARLEPLPDPLELPTDFPRPMRQGFAGEERVRRWDGDLASTIQSTARVLGVTPYVLLLSAFQLLLGRLSGRERFLVGSPVMGRHGRRHRDLIGYCANPLLLPIDLSRVESFAAHVQHNQALRKEMARHERVPLATILEQLDLGRDAARTSVAPHMFTYTRHHDPAGFASGLGFELLHGGQRGAAHELNLVVNHRKDGFFAHWRYNQDLFDRETIDALAEDFEVLLHHLCAAPHVGYAGLTVSGWNSGPVAEPIQPATASALLEAVKADRPALLSGSNILSHGELRVRVDAVAAAFEEGGVGNSRPVGLLLPRSDAQIAAMFACWKLGAPFFALDPSQPAERINRLVTGAGCTVIAGQGQRPTWLTEQTSWIALDRISRGIQPANPIAPRPEDAAYLLSTSGSTGEPKRVLVSHSALAHYAQALWERLQLPHGTVFATLAAPSTDLGYTSLFGALLNGATFRLIPEECMLDGEALAEHLAAHPVDVLKVVPSHFEALLALGGAALLPRLGLIFGGEAPSAALIETIARLAPDLAVFNHYGPTETTVGVTTDRLNVDQPIRLGRALRGNRLHVLDETLRPLPSGAEGDIYISGPQLARCYEGRADLTASAFVPDPFSTVPGARMYRSGDRGRRIGQQFAFAGRGDRQVKIRGNRVELGEVEAHLRTAPGVKDAAAIVIEHDGHKQIAACMVGGSVEEVSSFLRDHLPEAMIPSRWQTLEHLPRLPNGKVDRQEIASGFAGGEAAPAVPQVANATALECLRAIWKSVLRQPEIADSDNFFAIGGDSILALQLVAAAKRAGLKLTVQDIFQHQQLDALARVVGVTAGAIIPTASSAPGARDGRLAPIQAWFFANQRQALDHWNQSLLLKAVSWPSPDVLKAALDWLLARHPMLTTLYAQHEDGWRMGSPHLASKGIFEVIDVADIDDAAKTCDAAERSLSITDGPVFLARLIRYPGHDTQLFLTAHHLAVDGVSWRVIANDLIHACDTLASGSSLEPCSADHRYLAWAASKSPQADFDADCYHERLLPYTDPGLTGIHGNSRRHQIVLDSQLTARFGSGGGARVRDRLIAAWLDAWTAATNCTEALIDIEEHGRDSDHADCVGWFTSRFPVLFEPADLPSTDDDAIRERLAAVPSAVRSGALLHKEQMLRAECSINYLGLLDGGMDGVTIEPRPLETMRDAASCRTNAITIDGWLAGGRLSVELSFAGERYSASFAAILAERFEQALRAMASAVSDDDEARAAMLRLDSRIEHVWPMTATQRGILFECLRSGERDLYANVTVFRLAGEFDAERLRLAWLTVIGRHPMTRASADWLGFDEPRLIIRRGLKSDIFVEHHTIKAEEDEASLIDMIVAQQRQTGFDLERGPLMRLGLITIGPQRGLLVWARHHLIVDGWTSALLLEDLLRAYHSAPADPIPSLETYFDWLGRQDRRAAEAAWKNYLSGHEVATVSQRPGSSAAVDVHALNWEGDQALADRLRHLARSQSVTLANVLQFAWSCALAFERGSYDVLTGVTVSGRPADLDDADRMAGVFIASLPLRVKLDPRLSVGEGLRAMQIASAPLRDAFFLGMADIQRVTGIDPGQALFDTLLVIENYPHPDQVRLGGAEVTLLRAEERSQFGLMAQIQSLETLAATFRINRAQFDLQEGERIFARFRELLSALGREGVEAVCIPALLSCEIGEFVPGANLGGGVVDGLVSSFGAHGERVALVDGSGALGYGELSDLALGIARGLRASGVEAEDLVAVHLGRDRMLVAALLGVL
ncbi:MAG TPA: condensation domain-containing protein, partial [Novosphingobium sp.]|nr:condensation domain-containing protein [Novosphingobium sp.]